MVELVDALLAIPLVADDLSCRELIALRRSEIATVLLYYPVARLHVVSLVRACGRPAVTDVHPRGLRSGNVTRGTLPGSRDLC